MDNETFDQITIPKERLGKGVEFIKESENVEIAFNGSDIVTVELPITVELKIVETIPGVRGDTATNAQKPAKVETGAMVNVPLFINEGDIIKVDTRTGEYLERVKVG
jgi:elongation factor P